MTGFWDGRGISWTICKQSAPHSRQLTTPTPHHSIFTGRMLFLAPNQQRQSTEGIVNYWESSQSDHYMTVRMIVTTGNFGAVVLNDLRRSKYPRTLGDQVEHVSQQQDKCCILCRSPAKCTWKTHALTSTTSFPLLAETSLYSASYITVNTTLVALAADRHAAVHRDQKAATSAADAQCGNWLILSARGVHGNSLLQWAKGTDRRIPRHHKPCRILCKQCR